MNLMPHDKSIDIFIVCRLMFLKNYATINIICSAYCDFASGKVIRFNPTKSVQRY